jgi:hypothetical protein
MKIKFEDFKLMMIMDDRVMAHVRKSVATELPVVASKDARTSACIDTGLFTGFLACT